MLKLYIHLCPLIPSLVKSLQAPISINDMMALSSSRKDVEEDPFGLSGKFLTEVKKANKQRMTTGIVYYTVPYAMYSFILCTGKEARNLAINYNI